jgi:hypothetical protein
VTRASESAYRGDMIHVEGSAHVDGHGVADHVIDIYLSPAGQGGRSYTHLGTATTDKDGLFHGDYSVPGTLSLSSYEIFLGASEDPHYNAALSD